MSGRPTRISLGRCAIVALAAAGIVGTGASAGASGGDYPPIATIDPAVPTTTTTIAPGGTTPQTGSDSTKSGLMLGAGALGLGGGFVAVSRRRRHMPATST